MKARIYKPSKSAMQSGKSKLVKWVLEYEMLGVRAPNDIMGWTKAGDTLSQIKLNFDTAEDAVKYAESNDLTYTVAPEHKRKIKPKNYTDNFK